MSVRQTLMFSGLKVFSDLLQRHFHEDTAAEGNDHAIYSRVVVPALELPLNDSDTTLRDQLSRIWLAKARLLGRDSSFSLVGELPLAEKKDSYSRSMLAANRAFETARRNFMNRWKARPVLVVRY